MGFLISVFLIVFVCVFVSIYSKHHLNIALLLIQILFLRHYQYESVLS